MRAKLDIPLSLGEIIEATGGFAPHISKSKEIHAITTDTREMHSGDLFVPLKGARFDGEDFCEAARRAECFFITTHNHSGIIVDDASDALLAIAGHYRRKLKRLKKVVAITGSVGKTTTKELLLSIAKPYTRTHATSGNYNNYIGVAHTILSAPADTAYLVAEIGMNHLGEIARCSRAVKPDIGVITRIGTSHIGNLGSRQMIARAKLEIQEGLRENGALLIPYNEKTIPSAEGRKTVSIIDKGADYCLVPTESSGGKTSFIFTVKGADVLRGEASIIGDGNLRALSFAIACAVESGINEDDISQSFSLISEKNTRQKLIEWQDRLIIDDSYNASLESMISSFEFMRHFPGRRCAVLGDIHELGTQTEEIHFKVGAEAARLGIEKLFLFGIYSPFVRRGAVMSGISEDCIFLNNDPSDPDVTIDAIKNFTAPGDVVLFKGSHACRLDCLISKLLVGGGLR